MRRWVAYTVSALAAGAILWPAIPDRDDFPLSTYPMFSENLGRVTDIDTAVGLDHDGARIRLSPELIGGGVEVIHAGETVTRSILRGDTDALCREIADRARSRHDLVHIEVVTERHDAVAWFSGNKEPLAVTVHSTCDIAR
jgi:hypothetical protein